jgi:two-component system alkaline phosphatase synthesis response regulator PhoP
MKKRVLVVDDERPLANALDLKLSHEGFNVKAVYSGAEAVEALKSDYFDLVLLDLMMPQQDGFYVLDQIRQLNLHVVVIVSSNLSQKEDITKATSLGAVDYFVKSDTNLSDLVVKIKKYLDK